MIIRMMLFLSAFLVICSCAYNPNKMWIPDGYQKLNTNTQSGLYVRNDKFKDANFVRHENFFNPSNKDPFEIYSVDNEYLRINFHFRSDDWIFFKTVILLIGDQKLTFDVAREKQTDVVSGGIHEWADVILSDSDAKLLQSAFQNNIPVNIRFNGRSYYADRSITSTQRSGYLEIFSYYFSRTSYGF